MRAQVWVSGNVAADMLGVDQTNWRWGYGKSDL